MSRIEDVASRGVFNVEHAPCALVLRGPSREFTVFYSPLRVLSRLPRGAKRSTLECSDSDLFSL